MEVAQQACTAGIPGIPPVEGCASGWPLVLDTASLAPCARRAPGRKLCPDVPAPGADTFPLGCVPSAPPASRAPCALSVTHFALCLLRSTADVGAEAETTLKGLRSIAECGAEAQSTLQSLRAAARNTGHPPVRKDAQGLSAPKKQEEPDSGLHMTAKLERDLQRSRKHPDVASPRSGMHDASILETSSRRARHDVLVDGAGNSIADAGPEMHGASDTAISAKQPCGDRLPTPRRNTQISEVCTTTATTAKANRTKSTTPHRARGSTNSKPKLPLRQRPHSRLSCTEDIGSCLLSMVQHRSRTLAKMPSTVRSVSLDSQCLVTRNSQSSNVDSVTSAMMLDLHCGTAAEVAAAKPCTTSFALNDGLNFKGSSVLHRQKQSWLPQIQSAREVADPAWRSNLDTSLRPHRSRLRSVH